MKWETGNVININGISSAFDWGRNRMRLHKLGRIVNSVPSLLRDSYAFMPRLTPKCWIKHNAAHNYLIPHSTLRLYACYCLVWNFMHKKWFVSQLSRGKLRSVPPPSKPSAEAAYLTIFDRHIQHLNQSEFVVFEHIWRWEISDSAWLTVASSNPVMLAVPQLMYGADSWRAALRCLDLFNPADQPSDRSMCAGNGCQMRWGRLLEAYWMLQRNKARAHTHTHTHTHTCIHKQACSRWNCFERQQQKSIFKSITISSLLGGSLKVSVFGCSNCWYNLNQSQAPFVPLWCQRGLKLSFGVPMVAS